MPHERHEAEGQGRPGQEGPETPARFTLSATWAPFDCTGLALCVLTDPSSADSCYSRPPCADGSEVFAQGEEQTVVLGF